MCEFKYVVSIKGSGYSGVLGRSLEVCVVDLYAFPEEKLWLTLSQRGGVASHHGDTPAPFVEVWLYVSCHLLAPILPTNTNQTSASSRSRLSDAACLQFLLDRSSSPIPLHFLQATLQGGALSWRMKKPASHFSSSETFLLTAKDRLMLQILPSSVPTIWYQKTTENTWSLVTKSTLSSCDRVNKYTEMKCVLSKIFLSVLV